MPKKIAQLQYEVQKILDKRNINGYPQYYVLWKGYTENQCTWEPIENLQHAPEIIQEYKDRRKEAKKKLIRKRARQLEMREQNLKYNQERLGSFEEVKLVIGKNQKYLAPIPEVKPQDCPKKTKVMSFEQFLDRPPNQLVKVSRYDSLQGQWVQKLQTCAQIVGKNAARELYRTNIQQDHITIHSISQINGDMIVRFSTQDNRSFQCQLQHLMYICPNELIDYLLSCYDPVTNQLKKQKADQSGLMLSESQSE